MSDTKSDSEIRAEVEKVEHSNGLITYIVEVDGQRAGCFLSFRDKKKAEEIAERINKNISHDDFNNGAIYGEKSERNRIKEIVEGMIKEIEGQYLKEVCMWRDSKEVSEEIREKYYSIIKKLKELLSRIAGGLK